MVRANLHVVCDCSGSMDDMGKMQIAGEILSFLRDAIDSQSGLPLFPALRLAYWGQGNIEFTDLTAENAATLPAPVGPVESVDRVLEALDQAEEASGLLLLSDGGISDKEARLLKKWQRRHQLLACAIAIGADADQKGLKQIFGDEAVFRPHQVAIAAAWLDRSDPPALAPFSLAEIVWPDSRPQEDEADDWN